MMNRVGKTVNVIQYWTQAGRVTIKFRGALLQLCDNSGGGGVICVFSFNNVDYTEVQEFYSSSSAEIKVSIYVSMV